MNQSSRCPKISFKTVFRGWRDADLSEASGIQSCQRSRSSGNGSAIQPRSTFLMKTHQPPMNGRSSRSIRRRNVGHGEPFCDYCVYGSETNIHRRISANCQRSIAHEDIRSLDSPKHWSRCGQTFRRPLVTNKQGASSNATANCEMAGISMPWKQFCGGTKW